MAVEAAAAEKVIDAVGIQRIFSTLIARGTLCSDVVPFLSKNLRIRFTP